MSSDAGNDGPVLFAYDGSEYARAAIEQAGRQLVAGRRAIVLSVWQPFESVPFWGAPMRTVLSEMTKEVSDEAEKIAGEGAERARQAGFDAEPAFARGSPVWQRIVDSAQERGAGIIVMGSHGRSGVSYVALGSVATSVAHHANIPVLIAPLPAR
jgi:nucleotide-binding universal stress UspA family protein